MKRIVIRPCVGGYAFRHEHYYYATEAADEAWGEARKQIPLGEGTPSQIEDVINKWVEEFGVLTFATMEAVKQQFPDTKNIVIFSRSHGICPACNIGMRKAELS